MPIEFRCSQCGRLLRTPDDSAGRPAKCPECGTVQQVPEASTPPTPTPEIPSATEGSPFGAAAPLSPPPNPENPYQAPQYGAGTVYDPHYASGRVNVPGILLVVIGVVGIVGDCLNLLRAALMLGGVGLPRNAGNLPPGVEMGIVVVVGIGMALVLLAVHGLIVYGGLKMRNLENYSLAMAATILAMIPCLSPCCVLGIPFGIWALVVLLDDHVKAAFRS